MNEEFVRKVELLIEQVENAETEKLSELAKIADLNLDKDLVGVDLSGEDLSNDDLRNANLRNANLRNANLRNANLSDANLSGATVANASFGYNQGISEIMKRDLVSKGATFQDSLGIPVKL